uniref:Putative uracil-DNA glycosylase n=1 Tax=Hypsibius dujardini TaxID=232323 RepID=A0A0U3BGS9_HYPDU|nr:putative uracil-DNA glycosylase [Hypsibius dujardini]
MTFHKLLKRSPLLAGVIRATSPASLNPSFYSFLQIKGIMSRQTNIKQFFTTAPQKKRAATQNPEATEKDSVPSTSGSAVEPTLKKARTGSGDFKMVSNEIVKVKENSQNLVSLKAELVEQWKALRLLHPDFGLTWFKALKQEFSKEYFTTLSKFVVAERASRTVYPPPHQVFSWTQKFAIEQTKVVILGQDPYHGPGQAHGCKHFSRTNELLLAGGKVPIDWGKLDAV